MKLESRSEKPRDYQNAVHVYNYQSFNFFNVINIPVTMTRKRIPSIKLLKRFHGEALKGVWRVKAK